MKKSIPNSYAHNFNIIATNTKSSFKSLKLHTEISTCSTNKSHKTSVRKLLENMASLNQKKQ